MAVPILIVVLVTLVLSWLSMVFVGKFLSKHSCSDAATYWGRTLGLFLPMIVSALCVNLFFPLPDEQRLEAALDDAIEARNRIRSYVNATLTEGHVEQGARYAGKYKAAEVRVNKARRRLEEFRAKQRQESQTNSTVDAVTYRPPTVADNSQR